MQLRMICNKSRNCGLEQRKEKSDGGGRVELSAKTKQERRAGSPPEANRRSFAPGSTIRG